MTQRTADIPEQWPVESSEDLFRSELPFALRADVVRRPGAPDEEPFTRVVLEHPGAVVVLAVDDDERVLCLRQYRHPAGLRMLELPAGLLDVAGEEPRAAAERELREEAGLTADRWTPLVSAYSSPGITTELIHYFLAQGLHRADRGDFAARPRGGRHGDGVDAVRRAAGRVPGRPRARRAGAGRRPDRAATRRGRRRGRRALGSGS